MLWAIRRNALNYIEVRPWVLDQVVGWRPQASAAIATSITGAEALLPAGARLEHVEIGRCIWWSTPAFRAADA